MEGSAFGAHLSWSQWYSSSNISWNVPNLINPFSSSMYESYHITLSENVGARAFRKESGQSQVSPLALTWAAAATGMKLLCHPGSTAVGQEVIFSMLKQETTNVLSTTYFQ
eukprot:5468134-Ditylum_brightwellii.AAC.1